MGLLHKDVHKKKLYNNTPSVHFLNLFGLFCSKNLLPLSEVVPITHEPLFFSERSFKIKIFLFQNSGFAVIIFSFFN